MSEPVQSLGLSGRIARAFVGNPLTPVLALAGSVLYLAGLAVHASIGRGRLPTN